MTKGLQTLGISKSAIFLTLFMIVSSTSSFSIFEKDSDVSGNLNGEKKTTTNFNSKETGLIRKMLSRIDSDNRKRFENKQYFSNRHLYFKPRRKLENNVFLQNQESDTQKLHSILAKLESAERKPQKISSRTIKNSQDNNKDLPSSRTRRRRSSSRNFEGFFENLDSKANEDIWKSNKEVLEMYHKESSSIIHIMEDGSIIGKFPCDEYSRFNFQPVDHREHKTMVKIYGIQSKRYIAMNKSGKLYTTKNASDEDTDFLHEFEEFIYDSYLSFKHRRYITMRGDRQSSTTPAKAKKISNVGTNGVPKRAHFLVSNASFKEASPPSVTTDRSTSTKSTNHITLPTVGNEDVTPKISEKSLGTTITSTQEQSTETALNPDVTLSVPTTTTTMPTTDSSTTKKSKTRTRKTGGNKRCRKGKRGKRKGKRCRKKKDRKNKGKRNKDKNKKKRNRGKKRENRSVESPYSNTPSATQILNILGDFEHENLDHVMKRILQSPNFFDNPREIT